MGKNKLLAGLIVAGIAFMLLGGGNFFAVFFTGGITKGMVIGDNKYTGYKDMAYAEGSLSANSAGATFWNLKPDAQNGLAANDKTMTVFFNTKQAKCAYTLQENTNILDPVVLSSKVLGGDYKVYELKQWRRDQRVDVVLLGPTDSEQDTAEQLKALLQTANAPLAGQTVASQLSSTFTNLVMAGKGKTFDIYDDKVVSLGVYNIYFRGTTQGKTDCDGLFGTSGSVVVYSESAKKLGVVDRTKFNNLVGNAVGMENAIKTLIGMTTSGVDVMPDALKGKAYGVSSGEFLVVNNMPGEILVAVAAPVNLFYNPITNEVTEEPTPGSEEAEIGFEGFGEPAVCNPSIRDIAVSGDNTCRYIEGDEVTTYVKVGNDLDIPCLVTVSGSAGKSTVESKQVSVPSKSEVQVPINVKFGSVTGDASDVIKYRACSAGMVSGVNCDERTVGCTIVNKDGVPVPPTPSPEPEPDLTCQERAESRTCLPYDFGCEAKKMVDGFACYEYFLPSILGISLLTIIVGGVLGYVVITRILPRGRGR